MDTLTHNWHGKEVLLVPPVNAIGPALSQLLTCKAKSVLVAPMWPPSNVGPLLLNSFHRFTTGVRVFKGKHVLCNGFNKNSILGSPDFEGEVISIAINSTK